MRSSRFDISSTVISAPSRAGAITWQLAQVFWVGGIWIMHFVLLNALEKIGFAGILIQEVAQYTRPVLVGLALVCVLLQLWVLKQSLTVAQMLKDTRGQLLCAALLLAGSFFITQALWPAAQLWLIYSYLALGMCGLLLVIQPVPMQYPAQRA